MPKEIVDQRLQRLIESDVCHGDSLTDYKEELKTLARQAADQKETRDLSRVFKALSDPKRLGILRLLDIREMCVCELMVALDMSQPNLSHHIKILEREGFVEKRKEGKWTFFSSLYDERIKQLDL
ncbi:MAG TPA: metalloregulator ArsR/SmtB family transcription factor [Candidatus Krumholzibacteriaceae bacterium]|nr:metalloregulator ArsR/SmtB family transcription factor [Candidatus Krumholzibacteriaceae bacterium]